jgi:hypothetical protein
VTSLTSSPAALSFLHCPHHPLLSESHTLWPHTPLRACSLSVLIHSLLLGLCSDTTSSERLSSTISYEEYPFNPGSLLSLLIFVHCIYHCHSIFSLNSHFSFFLQEWK